MDLFDLNAEKREELGKTAIKRLKSEGMVPGILYDKDGNIPISLDEHDLRQLIGKNGADMILNLNLGGRTIEARIKEIQRDPVSQVIKHIDLIPVDKGTVH